jgi:peptide/nickel transport system ATP-binding protein
MKEYRRQVQMVFQDSYASLNPRMTMEESIAFGQRVHGVSAKEASEYARYLLAHVGLEPGTFCPPLSACALRRPASARSISPARWR